MGFFLLGLLFIFMNITLGNHVLAIFLCVRHMPRLYKLATLTSLMEYGFVSPWNGEHRCVT